MSRLSINNSNGRFVAMVTSLNSVARTLAIVVELFIGLLATIAKSKGLVEVQKITNTKAQRNNTMGHIKD